MSNPIVCPACGHPSWRSSWTGSFFEELNFVWQDTTQRYELSFDNEDQYNTERDVWICNSCGFQPGPNIQNLIEEAQM